MAPSSTMERAMSLALIAHEGQRDWNGMPFILHPIRVGMGLLQKYGEAHAAIGFLHDAVEDSEGRVTLDLIEQETSKKMRDVVEILTRTAGQKYETYLTRVSHDPWATRVKLEDLADNLSPFRLMAGTQGQVSALKRHGKALHWLRDQAKLYNHG